MSSLSFMNKSTPLSNTRSILPAVLGALASVLFVAFVTWAATTINNNVNTGGTLTVSGASTLTGTTTSGAIYASSTVFVDGNLEATRNTNIGAASGTPTTTFNVTGSGYLTGGLGIGNATTSNGNLLVENLAVFRGRLGISTTSPTVDFGLVGSGYLTGGFGVGIATTSAGGLSVSGMSTFNSAIDVRSGTSTITGAAVGLMGSSTPYLEVGIAGDTAIGGALGTSTLSLETTTGSRGGCIELRDADGRWLRMYAGSVGTTTGSRGVLPAGVNGLIVEGGRCQTGNE